MRDHPVVGLELVMTLGWELHEYGLFNGNQSSIFNALTENGGDGWWLIVEGFPCPWDR